MMLRHLERLLRKKRKEKKKQQLIQKTSSDEVVILEGSGEATRKYRKANDVQRK
jgi:hypothetical protein